MPNPSRNFVLAAFCFASLPVSNHAACASAGTDIQLRRDIELKSCFTYLSSLSHQKVRML